MLLTVKETTMPCTQVDYDKAVEVYLDRVRGLKDILSIYQFGSVSVPGLSDIDLIVVLKESLSDSEAKDFRIEAFDEKTQYVFMHQPFIMNQATFRNLNQLFYISNLRHISGKKLTAWKIDGVFRRNLDLIINVKRLSVLLRKLSYFLSKINIPSRECLVILNSFKYTIRGLAQTLETSQEEWDRYCLKTENLRKSWFDLLPPVAHKELSSLFSSAYHIANQLILLVDAFLEKHYHSLIMQYKESIDFEGNNRVTVYSQAYDNMNLEDKLSFFRHVNLESTRKIGVVFKNLFDCSVIILPVSFVLFGGRSLKETFETRSNPLLQSLRARNHVVDAHMEFLLRNGFDYGFFTDSHVMKDRLAMNKPQLKKKVEHWIRSFNEHTIKRKLAEQMKHPSEIQVQD